MEKVTFTLLLFNILKYSCSYNVGCTKRMGLFPNRRTSLENLKRRTLNGNYKNSSLDSKKKVRQLETFYLTYCCVEDFCSFIIDMMNPTLTVRRGTGVQNKAQNS